MIVFFNTILLHFTAATLQINLHYADWGKGNENNNGLLYDCLRVLASNDETSISREITSYCTGELTSKFDVIESDNIFPKFTFAELYKLNITSEHLYLWSAPIDIAEDYQYYLNQLSISNNIIYLTSQVFYNCTLPRFGSMCQYEIIYYRPNHSSLYDIIHDYYSTHKYYPTNFTCYTHFKCNRGNFPACLDWSEICDGQVHCLDGGYDEEQCWQIEINECNDNEYRCRNGQCIPKEFFRDDNQIPDCLDGSDIISMLTYGVIDCNTAKPSFVCEELICTLKNFLTCSCTFERVPLLWKAIYSIKDESISEECWASIGCLFRVPGFETSFCQKICDLMPCAEVINNTCPDMFYLPNVPIFFGDVYAAARKNELLKHPYAPCAPLYICYNNSRYDGYFINKSKIFFNNRTCFSDAWDLQCKPWPWPLLWSPLNLEYLLPLYNGLKKSSIIINYNAEVCNRPNKYQCANSSKCISIGRLMDAVHDCPESDDEDISKINHIGLKNPFKNYFKCELANKYIEQFRFQDRHCDCLVQDYHFCEDEDLHIYFVRKNISFQTICDRFTELTPININNKNETDETECEQWHCNNIYTRCDGLWNCPRGEDEIGCNLSATFNCPSGYHRCVSFRTNKFTCLPIDKANDGHIDCIGATDEPSLCQPKYEVYLYDNFHCRQSNVSGCYSHSIVCDALKDCDHGDDENFCVTNRTSNLRFGICHMVHTAIRADVEQFLCEETKYKIKQQIKYFSLNELNKLIEHQSKTMTKPTSSILSVNKIVHLSEIQCHRGFDLRLWLNNRKNITRTLCLCPPSFYGDICQYQNQRVSLTIQFRALSDSYSIVFAIIVTLIDDSEQRTIHSYEKLTYLSIRDCKVKFNIYLLYSTRPKNQTNNYAIHIDIYEKLSLNYRGSFLFPIKFSFLPVHRLPYLVDIPRKEKIQTCSKSKCIHGKCFIYSNNPQNGSFCQCNRGWSGQYCTISHVSMCSSDSIFIGVSAYNRSICVCPINKFGDRCLLVNNICQIYNNRKCKNGGQCIPTDEYTISNKTFTCICPKGYSGDQCELVHNKIVLSFEKGIVLSQSIFIHFIEVINNSIPGRTTTFRTIPLQQNSITIYWSQPFHLVFIELLNKFYYLAIIQTNYQRSITINTVIKSSNRCLHINELFNQTFVQMHVLRRIKYYHLPCQKYSPNFSCFYDDRYICICYDYEQRRLANCFDFNHDMKFDCLGQSVCENEGQCFQDMPDCPRRSVCICPRCFYGERCQFTSSGFGLSLDPIIGYHIQPQISLLYQPTIVKVSLAFTIIFMIAGIINGVLALITFNNKRTCETGCGLYLLSSAITTLFTTFMFGIKFWILLLAQMTLISNQLFLKIQCLSLDFILRVCLNMDQWLNACVAIERAITVIKAARFRKKKSKQAAQIIIVLLFIFMIGTSIYDPFYRRLIDEENEDIKRMWCIVTYPSRLKTFNSIVHSFHFFAPFILNLISAIILITKKSHQQSKVRRNIRFIDAFKKQIQQHKHLFTAPVALVILAIPRLILSFVLKCMTSTNDSWLFLIGYFISFTPPMLTFVVFVVPSRFYKEQFHRSISAYRTKLQRQLKYIW
ncbi:unnamed protein product [Rotaria sp. Silwood2]|nr:unnamed protein product [Rotaria sp. Silwood2]